MDLEKEVGRKIETLRTVAGLGQRELSDKLKEVGLNWSQGTLSKVENGTRPIRFTEAVRVAEVLKVSTAELQPTGGIIELLHQQAVWGLSTSRDALDDAHFNFTAAADRLNALRLVRELLSGNTGPYTVHGTGKKFIDHATQGIRSDEPIVLLDEIELLLMLGVPESRIQAKRDALIEELENRDPDERADAFEDVAFSEAAGSDEGKEFWIDALVVQRYTEDLLVECFPYLAFEEAPTRQFYVDGIENAHAEWTPDV